MTMSSLVGKQIKRDSWNVLSDMLPSNLAQKATNESVSEENEVAEEKQFKRGFLDGYYAMFQDDPDLKALKAAAKKKNDGENLDKRAFSVFVARRIRDNYMDICATLPLSEQNKTARFIIDYLKDGTNDTFFERKSEDTLLSRVFDIMAETNEDFSAEKLFAAILEQSKSSAKTKKLALSFENLDFLHAVSALRTEWEKKTKAETHAEKYILLTDIKKILGKSARDDSARLVTRDFAKEIFIVTKSLALCFDTQGQGKPFWDKLFQIFFHYMDKEALHIAAMNAFIDAVLRDLFAQKQIKAKYRNVGNDRDISALPETKNIFAQDITFKDVNETYYITKLIQSMGERETQETQEKKSKKEKTAVPTIPLSPEEQFKKDFEGYLQYHSAYISTASTSRFPAETGRLFEGSTNATGQNTKCTKKLLSIFSFCYFEQKYRRIVRLRDDETAESDAVCISDAKSLAAFCEAARIKLNIQSVFTDRNVFSEGFDLEQINFLYEIFNCINAVPRDFLYIFETTQRVVNEPNRKQEEHKDERSKKIDSEQKTVADYMASISNKIKNLCKGADTDEDKFKTIAFLKRKAENIIRICEGNEVHVPDIMIYNALHAAMEHMTALMKKKAEKIKDGEKTENPDCFFMNNILKDLEEKYNEAAERDFLCNQLLQRQDYASVRLLLFRFAHYTDFTNECTLDIDLLEMRNELLQQINDILIENAHYQMTPPNIIPSNEYCLTFADRVFSDAMSQNLLDANGLPEEDELRFILTNLARQTNIIYKNDPRKEDQTYRFRIDLHRLMLAGIGFARKYDGTNDITEKFIDVFDRHFSPKGNDHLSYYFEPFILFGTIALSYLSHESRKTLVGGLCQTVRQSRDAMSRPRQESCVLLLNNLLIQKYIPLSYHERKVIFDCIFATNMYPKQLQAYDTLKAISFYAEYARKEFNRFLTGEIASPIFIYIAASEAPSLPSEKILSTRVTFELSGKETLEDYFNICLRIQNLTWLKPKHIFNEETMLTVIALGDRLNKDILEKDDISKRKFALGTQMLLMALANLVRSERLPAEFAEDTIAPILIRSEYLQRKMNTDYLCYLQDVNSEMPNFWLLCGGLRYIAAIHERKKKLSLRYRVHLTQEELTLFEKCLLNQTRERIPRFFMMDSRLIDIYTDGFEKSEKLAQMDGWGDDLTTDCFLRYDNMSLYYAYRTATPKKQAKYIENAEYSFDDMDEYNPMPKVMIR